MKQTLTLAAMFAALACELWLLPGLPILVAAALVFTAGFVAYSLASNFID